VVQEAFPCPRSGGSNGNIPAHRRGLHGGAAAAVVAVGPPTGVQLSVSRVRQPNGTDPVTVDSTLRGLKQGDRASVTITVDSVSLAAVGLTPGLDGFATKSVAVDKIGPGATVSVLVRSSRVSCTSVLRPGEAPIEVKCG
jgi:hypothetical protein